MTQRTAVIGVLLLWAVLYGWSLLSLAITEPTGDGFTRGLNRITTFVGWQIAAGIAAMVSFLLAARLPSPVWLKWLARLPLVLALLLLVFILGVIAWANFGKPSPGAYTPPDRPVTQPSAPAQPVN